MFSSILSSNAGAHPTECLLSKTTECLLSKTGCSQMTTTYSLPTPKPAVSRSSFLPIAAMLSSAILAMGYAGPASADSLSPDTKTNATVNSTPAERTAPAQAAGEDTLARCQQLFGLL